MPVFGYAGAKAQVDVLCRLQASTCDSGLSPAKGQSDGSAKNSKRGDISQPPIALKSAAVPLPPPPVVVPTSVAQQPNSTVSGTRALRSSCHSNGDGSVVSSESVNRTLTQNSSSCS